MAFRGKVKIAVVGPAQSGKTALSNVLAEATGSAGGDYHPTQGVRILEFEVSGNDPSTEKLLRVEVELWDCAGSKQFESCWPAMVQDIKGVIFVYSMGNQSHERDLEKWYSYFVKKQKLRDSQCAIIGLQWNNQEDNSTTGELSQSLSSIHHMAVNLEENPAQAREVFNTFTMQLLSVLQDRQDKEEMKIVNK